MRGPCEGACFTDRKAQRGTGPWWPWESHSPPLGFSPSQGQVGGRGREGRAYLACWATWDSCTLVSVSLAVLVACFM